MSSRKKDNTTPVPLGRPKKFTPELADQIIDLIAKTGMSRARACEYVGISEDILRKWALADALFSDRLRIAELELERTLLTEVRNATMGKDNHDWKASAWLLARKWPELYSEKVRQEHSSAQNEPVKIVVEYVTAERKDS